MFDTTLVIHDRHRLIARLVINKQNLRGEFFLSGKKCTHSEAKEPVTLESVVTSHTHGMLDRLEESKGCSTKS